LVDAFVTRVSLDTHERHVMLQVSAIR
jgi:hypothetical protein